jgi:hypothetical protein
MYGDSVVSLCDSLLKLVDKIFGYTQKKAKPVEKLDRFQVVPQPLSSI